MQALCRRLFLLAALTAAVAADGVNDTLPAAAAQEQAANLTTRGGEGEQPQEDSDTSIKFLAEEEEQAAPAAAAAAAAAAAPWTRQDGAVSLRLTRLALALQAALRAADANRPPATLLFSPLSVSSALHLLWTGARGRTAAELAALLGIGTADPDTLLPALRQRTHQLAATTGVQVDLAHGLFLQYGYPVRTWFANVSRDVFSAEVYGVEFARDGETVASQINGWVAKKTRGRINKILHSALPVTTKMLIANAVYFNGEWELPFPLETTFMRPYTIPKGSGEAPEVLNLLMMSNSGELPYARSEELNCHVLGLPYKGKQVTMYLLLPIEHGLEAFRALEQNLTAENTEALIAATKETPVIISVPRMRILSTFHLREMLEGLGVKAVFDPVESDLGRMSPGKHVEMETVTLAPGSKPAAAAENCSTAENCSSKASAVGFPGRTKREADANPGLFVDDMIHKVEIEVTETGTVASAVTALTVTRDGSRIVLKYNRPFLFFIRHESTGLIMFWGSVLRPIT